MFERVKSHVDVALLSSNVGAELSFVLPKERLNKFEKLFSDLEQNSKQLGIDSFGVSVTTLEEVFIKYVYKVNCLTMSSTLVSL